MREQKETALAVIRTVAAVSNSAEAHFGCGEVNYGVVYAPSAIRHSGKEMLDNALVGREKIERQRFFEFFDDFFHDDE